eukprot:TRINITY_DN909_c0_g1_i2.p1 TRINITY_DN909_c0_g1~~TRINITY_DN909_c0_g1_i2.p1  ORF type:complete len:199 (+),score=81.92 TRINITY_DN909_c0_g1_i2:47-598(+)
MEKTLPTWAMQQKQLSRITAEQTLPINSCPPQFLGVLFSLFNVSGKYKTPNKESAHWMDLIKQTVREDLIPELKKVDMMHPCASEDYTLEEIPHFLSLMPIAQRAHCTVYDIPNDAYMVQNEDGEIVNMSKTEITRHKERGKYFEKKYTKLTETLLNMFNAEDIDPENNQQINDEDDNMIDIV